MCRRSDIWKKILSMKKRHIQISVCFVLLLLFNSKENANKKISNIDEMNVPRTFL